MGADQSDSEKSLAFGNLSAVKKTKIEDGPKVSVLMPAYNAGEHIAFAMQSILDQSWHNIELIVVDDASNDDTAVVAERFLDDPRVRVLRQQENQGAYAARNYGLSIATGDFVTVHDADDWAHPRRIEYQVRAMQSGADITSSSSVRFDRSMFPEFRLRQRRYLNDTCFPSFMFSRALVAEMGGWDEVRMGADSELYSRVCAYLGTKAQKVLPEIPLTFMLSDEKSLSGGGVTGRASTTYGARKQYTVAYKEWHRSLKGKPLSAYRISPASRPFPAPMVMLERDGHVQLDKLYIFDFTQMPDPRLRQLIDVPNGRIGVAHWPLLGEEMTNSQTAYVRRLIATNELPVCVPGDTVVAGDVIFESADLLGARPDAFADVSAERVSFLYPSAA